MNVYGTLGDFSSSKEFPVVGKVSGKNILNHCCPIKKVKLMAS
jgi:hypothetical protein